MFLLIESFLCSENNKKAAPEITVVPNSIFVAIGRHYPPALHFTNSYFQRLVPLCWQFYEDCLALIYLETFKFKSKFLDYINSEVAVNEVSKSSL